MGRSLIVAVLLLTTALLGACYAVAGQAPSAASDPDFPLAIEIASTPPNSTRTQSPSPIPSTTNCWARSALVTRCRPISVHSTRAGCWCMAWDFRPIIAPSRLWLSNAVNFIDTATNTVKHVAYVGRSPHEAFFTRDGKEVWVSVRGENYVSVLDGTTYEGKTRITVPNGPGMQIFSPDGKYGSVRSSFTPETVVIST